MDKITFSINRSYLRAIAQFAAQDDIRYYLNGALLELGPDGARLVATNGHMLGIINLETHAGLVEQPLELVLPNSLLKAVKKSKRNPNVQIVITEEGNAPLLELVDGPNSTFHKAIDGKFPSYRSAIPTGSFSGKVAHLDGEYMAAFKRAAVELGSQTPVVTVSFNGTAPAGVHIGFPEFFGVLMPYRASTSLESTPSWVHAPVKNVPAKADLKVVA